MKLNTTIIIINDTNNSDICLAVICDIGCHIVFGDGVNFTDQEKTEKRPRKNGKNDCTL